MESQIEKIVWAAVVKSVCAHSMTKPDIKTITPYTKITELFPTKNGVDEHANRLGFVMFNLFYYFNEKFNLRLKMDYSPRQEFELFPDMDSLYLYWYMRITGVDQPANKMEL